MKRGVVLDKNFLQGASADKVRALAASHRLIMPGALFYELMTTSPEVRRRCFSKLPQIENPVILVDHIGMLLAYEASRLRPAGQPSGHRIAMQFRFNEHLLLDDYVLPAEAQLAVDEQTKEVEQDVQRLIDLSETIPRLFPTLLSGTSMERASSRSRAEEAVSGVDEIHRFYSDLRAVGGYPEHPRTFGRRGKWAHIRWLQVLMLFAVDLHVRYQGRLRESLTPKLLVKLEHDIHDAQILALGTLEGAIATRERKLLRWWRLLNPNGDAMG